MVGLGEIENHTNLGRASSHSVPKLIVTSSPFLHMSELLYIPTKRRYHYRDPFFSEGDIAIRAAWLQKQDSQLEEYWHSVQEEAIDTQRYVLARRSPCTTVDKWLLTVPVHKERYPLRTKYM